MRDAFVCDYIRTPIGRFGGALASVRADDLAAIPLKALIARNAGVDWGAVDDVIYGCANQAGEDNRNVARMALLLAGFPVEAPGATINRLCGSGMDAVLAAARAIRTGEAELIVAGGVESMSRAPFVMPKAETAFSRDSALYDTTIGWRFVNPLMKKQYGVNSMPETAENVAEQFQVSRADQDAFALRSQQKAVAAQANGRLAAEITPVAIPQRKGEPKWIEQDEHPRADTTLEGLAKLKAPFRDGGSVTAGNASGVNDGAARADPRFRGRSKGAWAHADRPGAGRRGGRRAAAHHGDRPGAGFEEADGAAGAYAARFRRHRTQRGFRLAGPGDLARTRRRRRRPARQPERRRHRARPSARHVRRAPRRHGGARTGQARRQTRAGDDVHRRRAGHRHRHRASVSRHRAESQRLSSTLGSRRLYPKCNVRLRLVFRHGLVGSMRRRGNPYDNPRPEGLMKTLEVQVVYPMACKTFASR